jgi:lysophospholipase L1-like esterase
MRSRLMRSSWCIVALILCAGVVRADEQQGEKKPASCTPQEKNPERHEQFMKRKQEGKIGLLFIGDSITDGWRGHGKKIFEENYAKFDAANFGIGGDRTEHILWRIDHGELDDIHPKAVVLMIGTNNLGTRQSVEDTVAGIKCDVEAIHKKLPDSKILLLAVFPRGHKADDPFRAQIKEVNEEIAKFDGKDNVKFLDINKNFLDDDGSLSKFVMPDYLHPHELGYEIWAKAMQPTLDELMR